ncbi:MAG: UDP-N-acetylmuramoyl-L-alanine--D-glutamate ligase [Halioglobus sp.]|mgnify:CR=1 FL=1|nr:UDP-N-acetylmuramoyl-L-alanine--D-glutamate ligase [Halioglobus sp.]
MLVAPELIASTDNRVIVGLGATGLSCARYLYRAGTRFSVVDTRSAPPGLAEMRAEMPDIAVFAGDCPEDVITGAGELVVSPGVALDQPLVALARARGVPVVGDIDLFMREAQAPVVGITGSNAKSTVTELLGQMARDAGLDTGVGGNLGTPALDLLAPQRELYVLELSSFQLERAAELDLSVAAVLNISPDHLDRHGSMIAYHQAKHRIFRGCRAAVVHRDDPLTVPLVPPDVDVVGWRMGEPELGGFGLRVVDGREYLCRGFESLMPADEVALPGRHNLANALAALALGNCVGLPVQGMTATLRRFRGLPHRCELVGERAGVRFVNDSKGTNTGATRAALQGLGGANDVVLIAGGQGKGADFADLREAVAAHCRQLVLIGEDAPLLQAALQDVAPVACAASMDEAVRRAAAAARPGDTVLLSPACASFDMFSGYAERGEQFCAAVAALPGGAA